MSEKLLNGVKPQDSIKQALLIISNYRSYMGQIFSSDYTEKLQLILCELVCWCYRDISIS